MTTTSLNRPQTIRAARGNRGRALVVAAAPVLLTAALLWHPPLPGRLPDSAGVADAASSDFMRWGLSHVAIVVAFAAVAVAFVAMRGHLRDRGDAFVSAVGLALVLIGSTLYAMLPGMEFAVLAAHETGADLAQTQAALESWFVPILLVGAATFALGTGLIAAAVVRGGLFRMPAHVVAGALIVFGLSRLVPVGVVQFYVQSAAALAAMLPMAMDMWASRQGADAR